MIWHQVKGILKGLGIHLTLFWALFRGWWAIACALLLWYSFIYIYLYSHNNFLLPLVNSFILTQEFYLVVCLLFFFPFSSPSHWEGRVVNKQLCGVEPPAELNHNTSLQEFSYSKTNCQRWRNNINTDTLRHLIKEKHNFQQMFFSLIFGLLKLQFWTSAVKLVLNYNLLIISTY